MSLTHCLHKRQAYISQTYVHTTTESYGIPPRQPQTKPIPPSRFDNCMQHVLTRQQQDHVDRERRLTADHMRVLNQVLAGHLSYDEVPEMHTDREAFEAFPVAPSHGSATFYAPAPEYKATTRPERESGMGRRSSRRQTILLRLVRCIHRSGSRLFCSSAA